MSAWALRYPKISEDAWFIASPLEVDDESVKMLHGVGTVWVPRAHKRNTVSLGEMGCLLSQPTTQRNNETIKFRRLIQYQECIKFRSAFQKLQSFNIFITLFPTKGLTEPLPPNLHIKVGICQVHNRILRQVILFLSDQSSSGMRIRDIVPNHYFQHQHVIKKNG